MIGKLFENKYCIIISVTIACIFFIFLALTKFIFYRIAKSNNHSFSKKLYKRIGDIYIIYAFILSIIIVSAVWLGLLIGAFIFLLFVSAVIIRYVITKEEKALYEINQIVKNNKFDLGDYINANGYDGKVTNIGFNNIDIESLDGKTISIDAREISNLINYSRNVINIKVEIKTNSEYQKIKNLLEKELPSLIQDCPFILEGPNVDGVRDIEYPNYSIILSAKVKFEDITKAKEAIQARALEIIKRNE